MKKPFRIAVLASTRGTDLQAIIDEMQARRMKGVELSVVVSDQEKCEALERAKAEGFDTVFVDPEGKTREEFNQEVMAILDEKDVDLVCLVGFMRILSAEFVNHYKWRLINVHPSLLPKHGGKGFIGNKVHEAVLQSGDKKTGMTIHFVTEDCDAGPIIHQEEVDVDPDDTVETLRGKVQKLEKTWYPKIITWLQHGKIVIDED